MGPDMTGWNDEDVNNVADAVGRIVIAAVEERGDVIDLEVNTIMERYEAAGMFGLCNGLAAAFKSLMCGDTPVGLAQLMVVGGVPEDLPPEARPLLFATRFLAAHLNGDHAMKEALFVAPIHAGDLEAVNANLNALINTVADVARQRQTAVARKSRPSHPRQEQP